MEFQANHSPPSSMEFDLQNPVSQDLQQSLFAMESDHLPLLNSDLDSDHHLRRQIINLISQKLNHPFVSYLAINYFHRFHAIHSIPGDKPWILKLVAASCVSLAFKMIGGDSGVQKDGELPFDIGIVEKMEFLILGALGWRMRSITPFAFIKIFVSFFKLRTTSFHDDDNATDDDDHHHQDLKDRATEIIFKAQIDSKLLDFKPSLIAASALLCASHELYPLQFPYFKNSISSCSYVNEDELSKCYSVVQELVMDDYESMLSCKTPINVLDLDYSSSGDTHSKTDEDETRELKSKEAEDKHF